MYYQNCPIAGRAAAATAMVLPSAVRFSFLGMSVFFNCVFPENFTFQKIYELKSTKFFHIFSDQNKHFFYFFTKIDSDRCVSTFSATFYADPCEISHVPRELFFRYLKSVLHHQEITATNFYEFI